MPIHEIDPDLAMINTYNSDKGIGVIFNYYIVNINQDSQNIDPSTLDTKIKDLQNQIENLIRKIEDLTK
jgi:hypothetical protein